MAWRILAAAALCCTALAGIAHAEDADDSRMPAAPLNEQVLTLAGDPARAVLLQVTLFTPGGAGPFPLAIMNHGATQASATNRGERYRLSIAAYYFLSRGYAVALPMARGFAGSEGKLVVLGCDLAGVASANARDLRAVIEALQQRPDIDRTRVVVAGQSFGAWNALGLGADPPAGVRGLVAFNPALRSSDCAAQDRAMADGAGQLGAHTALPSLWFYGDNDTLMPNATWRAVFDRYRRAGARAELVDVGTVGADSHQMLSSPDTMKLWTPRVDAFLARIGLPAAIVAPGYLPTPPPPPPTHAAALTDAAALPLVGDGGRTAYQRFLASPKPRAFVIGATGSVVEASGGYDPLGYALRRCHRLADATACAPYAVNDEVVWQGPKAGEPSRVVAKRVRGGSTTSLATFFDVNRDCSIRGVPKLAVTDVPQHGSAMVGPQEARPAFPPASPFAACNAAPVAAVGVSYTPMPGYAGPDSLTIDETALDGRHQVIRIDLTVAAQAQ